MPAPADTPDALERLVNLALYLAKARAPVTAEDVRADVQGYPPDQDETAFLRMFERDKEDLRAAGLAIVAATEGDGASYRVDPAATYAGEIDLTREDALALRTLAAAIAADDAFPFGDDLRRAALKLGADLEPGAPPPSTRLACEDAGGQGRDAAMLSAAAAARKRVAFGYENSLGQRKRHEVEPFGVFLREGRWYLVGRDVELGETRTYAVPRMTGLTPNSSRPRSPDFDRPERFDVASYVRLPFQYGPERGEAVIGFEPEAEWRAAGLVPAGGLEREDGRLAWRVRFGDSRRLMRWVVENGPGVRILEPPELAERLRSALEGVAERHG